MSSIEKPTLRIASRSPFSHIARNGIASGRRAIMIGEQSRERRRAAAEIIPLADDRAEGNVPPGHHPKLEGAAGFGPGQPDLGRSEEHTSELQSLMRISYAVFCLNKKK